MVTQARKVARDHLTNRLPEMVFNEIESPGSYVTLETGTLFRVPPDALAVGHSPLISVTASGEVRVAKLSNDPAAPITKLRTIAADNDIWVDF
ncbi:MAG: hypothetical protein ACE5JR_03080 [Gemmatimonadota bacterium]